jgi:hypothetical protein
MVAAATPVATVAASAIRAVPSASCNTIDIRASHTLAGASRPVRA